MSKNYMLGFLFGGIAEDVRGAFDFLSKDIDLNKMTGENFGQDDQASAEKQAKHVDSDDDDINEIKIDSDEEKKIKFGSRAGREDNLEFNAFQKINQDDDEDYEDYFDSTEKPAKTQSQQQQQQEAIPKKPVRVRKPIPANFKVEEVLGVFPGNRNETIYKFSNLFYPEHHIIADSLLKTAYEEYLRDPDQILRQNSKKVDPKKLQEFVYLFHQAVEKQEKERQHKIQEINRRRQGEAHLMEANRSVQKPQDDFRLKKDIFDDPYDKMKQYTKHQQVNSHEWFSDLKGQLLGEMRPFMSTSTYELEKEIRGESSKKSHVVAHSADPFGTQLLKKSLAMESASRQSDRSYQRSGTTNLHDTPNRSETPSKEFHSLHHFLDHLDSVQRDNRDLGDEMRNFGDILTEKSKVMDEVVNTQYYMQEHQGDDSKFLQEFRTTLFRKKHEGKGHNSDMDIENHGGLNHAKKQKMEYYDEGSIQVAFRSDLGRRIFDYEEEENIPQEPGNEGAASNANKKIKISKRFGKVNINANNLDLIYCNNHLLQGSWKEFFAEKPPSKELEKDYSSILIDLNDRSLFYHKINPIVFGAHKAQVKRVIPEVVATDPNASAGSTAAIGTAQGALPDSAIQASKGEGAQVKEPEVAGIERLNSKTLIDIKKTLRTELVKRGLDPDNIDNIKMMLESDAARIGVEKKASSTDNNAIKSILGFENDILSKNRRLEPIQDSRVAENFEFNEFLVKDSDFTDFHRPSLMRNRYKQGHTWKVEIVKNVKDRKKDKATTKIVASFEHFKNQKRLSLREGAFALFEFIEETPLIIPNVGMASRILRYVYPERVINQLKAAQSSESGKDPKASEEKIDERTENNKKFYDHINEKLGPNGVIRLVTDSNSEKPPLMANITNEKYIGIPVLENNLYVAPIFPQKPKTTDFVLVRHVTSEGYTKFFLRKIESLYTVGQIEPRREVFTPHSRALRDFFKKCLQFVIKDKFKKGESVDLRELNKIFPTYNEHNLRKQIRDLGGEQDPKDSKKFSFNKDKVDSDREGDAEHTEGTMKPDDVCLYERMHTSRVRLKNLGLEELKSCDKINTVKLKYIKKIKADPNLTEEEKAKKCLLARYIAEELQLTAWNLSQSFSDAKQKKGRLYLTGFGDPTNGHGGYSYVKFPMKTSRYDKDESKKKDNDKANMITGTDADLRSLENKTMEAFILKYRKDINPEYLSKLHRWDKKNMVTEIANENPNDPELKKYIRVSRITTKEQKQKYQKEINKLFSTMLENMTKQTSSDITSEDDWELEHDIEKEAEKEFQNLKTEEKVEEELSQEEDDG